MMRIALGVVIFLTAGCGAAKEPQPPSVAELTAMLQNQDQAEQIRAANWVQQLGPKAAETAPALKAALKSPHAAVRSNAAMALARIGPAAENAVADLTAALADSEYNVRKAAADALGEIGPAAAAAIPALEALSQQPDKCGSAQSALTKIRK
jgi:HEAT repeat protein